MPVRNAGIRGYIGEVIYESILSNSMKDLPGTYKICSQCVVTPLLVDKGNYSEVDFVVIKLINNVDQSVDENWEVVSVHEVKTQQYSIGKDSAKGIINCL